MKKTDWAFLATILLGLAASTVGMLMNLPARAADVSAAVVPAATYDSTDALRGATLAESMVGKVVYVRGVGFYRVTNNSPVRIEAFGGPVSQADAGDFLRGGSVVFERLAQAPAVTEAVTAIDASAGNLVFLNTSGTTITSILSVTDGRYEGEELSIWLPGTPAAFSIKLGPATANCLVPTTVTLNSAREAATLTWRNGDWYLKSVYAY